MKTQKRVRLYEQIWCNVWELNHDPDCWEDPWTFKPERFLDEQGQLVEPSHPNRRRWVSSTLAPPPPIWMSSNPSPWWSAHSVQNFRNVLTCASSLSARIFCLSTNHCLAVRTLLQVVELRCWQEGLCWRSSVEEPDVPLHHVSVPEVPVPPSGGRHGPGPRPQVLPVRSDPHDP